MNVISRDDEEAVFVARLKAGGDEQADFREVLGGLRDFLGTAHARRPAVMVMLGPGHALPDAASRKLAAEITGADNFAVDLAVVTKNPLFSTVLVAINWLRRTQAQNKVCGRAAEAVRWLEEQRGTPLPKLAQLAQEAMLGPAA